MRMSSFLALALLLSVLATVPAHAGDEPTAAELAGMILDGNEGEHALVAAWLQQSDRALLLAVFKELRALKARRGVRARPAPAVRVRKDRGFRMPLPEAYRNAGRNKDTVITAEVRLIDVPADGAAAFLGAQRPTAKRKAIALTQAQARALLEAVDEREEVNLVSAPRMTVYDGQKSNVSVLNEVAYIKDYDVEVAKDGTKIADPVIATIQDGTVIQFQPSLAADNKSIGLRFNGTFAAVTRPIPEVEMDVTGSGQKVKIQIPEVRVLRVNTTVYVPDGGWVLIGGGIQLEPKKGAAVERVTLVHLKSQKLEGKPLEEAAKSGEIDLRPVK